jgi:hypothetical protein
MLRTLYTSFIIAALLPVAAHAQDQLLYSVPGNATGFTTDNTGKLYVIKADNSLVRYNEKGDSTAAYNELRNGRLTAVDALNPLKLVLYYGGFSRLVLLDRMMALKNSLDLRTLGITATTVVAASADGNIWIFDNLNSRLKKMDEQMNMLSESNDLRQELADVLQPVFMAEQDRKLYLCDTASGVFVFDRYGTYITTFPIKNCKQLQVFGDKLVYPSGTGLMVYDMISFKESRIDLPGTDDIKGVRVERGKLFIWRSNRVDVYALDI